MTADLLTEDLTRAVSQFEQQGFTLLSGYVDRAATAAVRISIDEALAAGRRGDTGTTRSLYRIMQPYDKPIMSTLAADERIAAVARACLRCVDPSDLRLRQ